MNRHFNIILGVVVVASALSCAREEIDFVEPMEPQQIQEDNGVRTVTFRALETTTKAQFGDPVNGSYPTLWTANDSELKLSLNYGSALSAGVTPSQDYTTATFSATVDFNKASAPYTFYAVSPASAAQALSLSREAWKVTIPCKQTPTAGSVDEAGIIIAASSAEYSQETSVNVVNMQFEHLTAYGRMSLSNLALAEGETVQSVELTATTPLVGDWFWKCADGHQLTDFGASSTVTINTTSTSNIWFACAPVTVSDEVLVVRVFTDQGVFEQLTAFPTGSKFTAGKVAVFTINMSGADYTSGSSSPSDAMLQRTDYGCYLGTGKEWVCATGTNQVTRAYSSTGVQTYTLINPSTVEELEITGFKKSYVKGDAVNVSVKWKKGYMTFLNNNYQMHVIKEEGPKVWLGDGSGMGFIIKK